MRLTHCAHCGIEFLTDPRNAGRTDLRCPFGCRRHHYRQCSGERSAAYYRTRFGKFRKKRHNARRTAGVVRCEQVAQPGSATLVPPDACALPGSPPPPVTLVPAVTPVPADSPAAPVTPAEPDTATAADTLAPPEDPPPPVTPPVPSTPADRATPTAADALPAPVTAMAALVERSSLPVAVPSAPATAHRSAEPEFELRVGEVVLTTSSLSRSGMLPYVGLLFRLIDGLELSRRELLELLERSLRQRRMVSRCRREYVLEVLHQHPP